MTARTHVSAVIHPTTRRRRTPWTLHPALVAAVLVALATPPEAGAAGRPAGAHAPEQQAAAAGAGIRPDQWATLSALPPKSLIHLWFAKGRQVIGSFVSLDGDAITLRQLKTAGTGFATPAGFSLSDAVPFRRADITRLAIAAFPDRFVASAESPDALRLFAASVRSRVVLVTTDDRRAEGKVRDVGPDGFRVDQVRIRYSQVRSIEGVTGMSEGPKSFLVFCVGLLAVIGGFALLFMNAQSL